MHVLAALVEGGFPADDIKEIILQQAIYLRAPPRNSSGWYGLLREAGGDGGIGEERP